jgi:hypothetical protein
MPVNRQPAAADVAAVVGTQLGEPLAELEAAYADARAAVRDLETHRPGGLGTQWRRALEEDAKSYATGARPKRWKAAHLLETDAGRWAAATAACGDLPAAVRRCEQRLDRVKIVSVAAMVMDTKAQQWAKAAAEGWTGRRDEADAWQHYRHGEELFGGFASARAVRVWAGWSEPDPTRVTSEQGTVTSLQSDVPPTVHTLPPDPIARGQWLCLGLVLRPDTQWLWLPPIPAVQWPDATEELRERAVGDNMERFLALRQHGYYSGKR